MSSIFLGFGFSPGCPRVCSAKRTRVFSLWLTARTTNCPSTLKKGASQSKSLLNDRVRSLFGRSLEPLLSSGRQLPPLLLLPAPRRFPPFPPTLFTPRAPLVFQPRAFAVFFRLSLCRSYRRFVSPRRPTCPRPAAFRTFPDATPYCFANPPSAFSAGLLSPLFPDVHFTPLLLNDYPARTLPPARRFPY